MTSRQKGADLHDLDALLSMLQLSSEEVELALEGSDCYYERRGERFWVAARDLNYLSGLLVSVDSRARNDGQARLEL